MSKEPTYDASVVRKPGEMKPVPGNPQGMVAKESLGDVGDPETAKRKGLGGLAAKSQDLGIGMKPVPGSTGSKVSGSR